MPLPLVPLDSNNEKQHRTVIATTLNELVKFYNTIQSGNWTPVVRGSGTAGTYEISSTICRYTRIGRLVRLDVGVSMAAVVTGGGTGTLEITGAPYTKVADTFPIGAIATNGLDFATTGAFLVLRFNNTAATSTLQLRENVDNATGTTFAVSGIGANDSFFGSIWYETDDP